MKRFYRQLRLLQINALVLMICLFVGCEQESASQVDAEGDPSAGASQDVLREGLRVMRLHCLNCHGFDGKTQDGIVAPSLWGVRQHYLKKYPDRETFVAAMTDFMIEPSNAAVLMPKAVGEYGLMPAMMFDESELRTASEAIYAGHVARPTWWRTYADAHQECGE